MSGELHAEVLGQLRAVVDGADVVLGPSRQRAVFAVLVSQVGRAMTRDELVDAVWGDSAPASAGGSLHTYVSGLRRVLGPAAERLSTVAGGYQLTASSVDVEKLTQGRSEAHRRLREGDRAGAIAALDAGLALWRGEPYAGVTGPYVEQERRRLGEMRLGMLEQRARTVLELGRGGEVVTELQGLVRDHPLHEVLYELLMRALASSGRTAEALEVYQTARGVLIAELGIEPGTALRKVQRDLLAGEIAEVAPPVVAPPPPPVPEPIPRLRIVPAHVTRARSGVPFIGRRDELELLSGLVDDLAQGRGNAVWLEGEAGIGKSELLTSAFARATAAGCQVAWGIAEELGQRVPFQALMEALGLETTSSDPRLAAAAERLQGEGDTGLLGFIREACLRAPLLLIVDDMHWADESSVLVWGRLASAVRRLPLLLVAASRPDTRLGQLRRALIGREAHILDLKPLSTPDVETLIGDIVGGAPGEGLRYLAARTGGNPLYTREMAADLVRQRSVTVVDGVAEVDGTVADRMPASLIGAVRRTLESLSPDTQEVLRLAALLGMEFAAADVVALTGRSPVLLVRTFDEAAAAHVIVESGQFLTFRHPFLRQALHDAIPVPLRSTLRRHAAEALARAGSPVNRIAEQLAAEVLVVDTWVVGWMTGNLTRLIKAAPRVAGDLLRQVLATDVPTREQRETLLLATTKLLFRLDEFPEAEAREALGLASAVPAREEMRHLLATMRYRRGDEHGAIGLLNEALERPEVPELWRTRHRILRAQFSRGSLDDLDKAEHRAVEMHELADSAYEKAFALQTRWLIDSIRRDHLSALNHVDQAIETVGDEDAALLYDLMDNRVFSLQNLDRLDEAGETIRSGADVARRYGLPASLQVAAAVQYYWQGRWDEALTEISEVTDTDPAITFHGTREPPAVAMLLHGVAALIAGRRGDPATAKAHLEAAEAQLPATIAEREACDFLLMARSLTLVQEGRPEDALAVLAPLWEPTYAPLMLRHQWLPDIVRLARSVGNEEVAATAASTCADEAAAETVPARAFAAAARIRTLRTGNPEHARQAAEHYRAVGRLPELGAALEEAGDPAAADIYRTLGAAWDLRRVKGV
ncbi:BTAD domain-containing putative transcriptional regulator [Actinoplanes sp. NPDC051470]|uniref:BTAD domain-containing putative transcriptional regulator n=1 Tax=unclassified Actinoplanes TaxID=2626549 RepID=UPI0034323681